MAKETIRKFILSGGDEAQLHKIGWKPLQQYSPEDLQVYLDLALHQAAKHSEPHKPESYASVAAIIETEIDRRNTLQMVDMARKDAATANRTALWAMRIAAATGIGQIIVQIIGLCVNGK